MTFGLPSVSDSEPKKARSPARRGRRRLAPRRRRGRRAPGEVKQVGGAGVLDGREGAGESVGERGEARAGDNEPDHVADYVARNERGDADEPVGDHPRDERRQAGPGRGDGGEINRREQDKRAERHRAFRVLRRARVFSASTSDEKNIAA